MKDKFQLDDGKADFYTEMEYSASLDACDLVGIEAYATYSVDYDDKANGEGFYSNSQGEWESDVRITGVKDVSFGASLYFIFGIGFNVSFDFSEFSKHFH